MPYVIDVTVPENKEAIVRYLADRKSPLNEKTVDSNTFILTNRANDIWFWEYQLVQLFEKETENYFKYFEGPRVLPNVDFMLGAQSHDNDIHCFTYIKDPRDKQQLSKLKYFRKMN